MARAASPSLQLFTWKFLKPSRFGLEDDVELAPGFALHHQCPEEQHVAHLDRTLAVRDSAKAVCANCRCVVPTSVGVPISTCSPITQ